MTCIFFLVISLLAAQHYASFFFTSENLSHLISPNLGISSIASRRLCMIFVGLIFSRIKLPWIQTNIKHLKHIKKAHLPLWLFIIVGWILGSYIACLNTNCFIPDYILLCLPPAAFFFNHLSSKNEDKKPNLPKETGEDDKIINQWFHQEIPIFLPEEDLISISPTAKGIADRVIANIENHTGTRIGVVGEFGSGKSSMINLIGHYLSLTHNKKITIIICKIDLWAFPSSSVAQENILRLILKTCSHYFDIFPCASMVTEWKDVIKNNHWWLFLMTIFGMCATFDHSIEILAGMLKRLNYHLVLVIENIDRKNDKEYCPKQIQALLEHLKLGLECTIIVAGSHQAIDFTRLCEYQIPTRLIPHLHLQNIFQKIFNYHMPNAYNWSQPKQCDFSLFYHDITCRLDFLSIWDLQRLIGTPRNLKHFLRQYHEDWNYLKGEVDYWDFFLLKLVQIALPESYDFIAAHRTILIDITNEFTHKNAPPLNQDLSNLKKKFLMHRDNLGTKAIIFDKIFRLLFGDKIYKKFELPVFRLLGWPNNLRQRISSHPHPTNYLDRVYRGTIEANEISDKEIDSMLQQWRSKHNKKLLVMLEDPLADLKFGSYYEKVIELDNVELLELLRQIIIYRSLDKNRNAVVIDFAAPCRSAKSALIVLQEHCFHRFFNSSDTFFNWVVSLVEELCKINLQSATKCIRRFLGNENFANQVSSDQWKFLKTSIETTVFTKVKNNSKELALLFPKNDLYALYRYLLFLSSTKEILQSHPSSEYPEIIFPHWIKNSLDEVLFDSKIKEKPLLQVIGILFKNPFDDTTHGRQGMQLREEQVFSIFPNREIDIMKLIVETDFSNTILANQSKKIKTLAQDWIEKNNSITSKL